MNTKSIAKVNNVSIVIIDNGEKLVPIKPICEALGIDSEGQRQKIKADEILNSVTLTAKATGSDGKNYEMVCIPFKFVFGWLFTINPKNVNLEARDTVKKYKLECYDVLYRHFTEHSDFLTYKQAEIEKHIDEVDKIREEFNTAKNRLTESRKRLTDIKELTFDTWKGSKRQLEILFPNS